MADEMEGQGEQSSGYGKRPLWQWVVLYLFIAVILYGLLYYFVLGKKAGTSTQTNTQPATPTAMQAVTPTPAATASASPTSTSGAMTVQKFTITGTEFAFTPSALTVKKGEAVQITFKNAGAYPHNLTISALGVGSKTIQPGQTDTFTFTPAKAGSYTYICTVPGHADRGMKGTLTVQ